MIIKLVLKNEESEKPAALLYLDEPLINIGSSPLAAVVLSDSRVAPEQAVIFNENGNPLFINQAKGTFFNGGEIEKGAQLPLSDGDEFRIGAYSLKIVLGEATENRDAPAASFAEILTGLRTEEDEFYFQIVGENGRHVERMPIQREETALGWDAAGDDFTNERENMSQTQAIVRKDWSGVTIYPHGDEPVRLNGALLEAGQRLRNGDKLIFTRKISPTVSEEITLVFSEPAALVELNSMLPEELLTTALETSLTADAKPPTAFKTEANGAADDADWSDESEKNQRYFRYFTPTEIFIMTVATVVTAVLTFLLLEMS